MISRAIAFGYSGYTSDENTQKLKFLPGVKSACRLKYIGGAKMEELEYGGKKIQLDDTGFLVNLEDWDEQVAQVLAEREGIGRLNDDQLEIIKFMRSYYDKFNAFPILNNVCKNIRKPKECVSEEFINPEKAWKIAGLPKLSGINFVTVDGKNYRLEECC